MADADKLKARKEAQEFQKLITENWKKIAKKYPETLEDFFQYTEGLAAMYRMWAEEQEMMGVPLDDHKVSQLLQQARTCDTVRTYITSRIDQDVAQPIKKSK